jgi:hypothetical protein
MGRAVLQSEMKEPQEFLFDPSARARRYGRVASCSPCAWPDNASEIRMTL